MYQKLRKGFQREYPLADGNNRHSFEVKIGEVIGEERYSQRSFKANLFCRVVFPPLIDWEVGEMLKQESPMMRKANTTIEIMEMSPRDKWLYDSRMKYEHDRASCINEGYRQGLDKGAHQKALETAAAFKKMGIDIEKIAEGTGLSKEEVEKL